MIRTADHLYWFNDGLGRLGGGVLAYFLYDKINGYLFLLIFSIFSFIGHAVLFLILTLNVDGGFMFTQVSFWLSLGAGAYWVLTAQIIIDDGGIRNFGMNWGNAVFFNFLGIFFFQLLTFFINFKSAMGVVALLTGILVPVFAGLAWHFDKKDNNPSAQKGAQQKPAGAR